LLKKSPASSARARIRALPAVPAEHSPELPALNGRSVRNLRHVRAVKAVRGGVAAAAASFAVVIALGFGLPAYAAANAAPPVVRTPALQSLTVSGISPASAVVRDTYGVTLPPPVQWPVDPSSPIVDGFGPRVSPCSGCSSNHEGVDYDAGNGAPVHAIAAGVVVETNNPGWAALGIHVAIQHVIEGQTITSAYGHMQVGSMPLRVGDTVFAGELIGRVGSTGASTGAHLHFEIRAGGTRPVDPVAWMRARLG
jgi:murein DD-endopeptidase MepM/ murein hydrolase activator NlpD